MITCKLKTTGKKLLSEKMFGLFFEDINYGADGGLHAEMIENRQFAFRKAWCAATPKTYDTEYVGGYGWNVVSENGTMDFIEGGALNEQNPHFMRFTVEGECGSFANKAYDGVCMKAGESYNLLMWLRSADYRDKISIVAKDNGTIAASAEVSVTSGEWTKVCAVMTAKMDVVNGSFEVCQKSGSVDYAYISLIPANSVAGVFRKDLFDMLNDMKPGFLRFPGGCIVEGANLDNRYRWKDTVGEPWNRKWNWSRWAVHDVTMGQGEPLFFPYYNQSYGVGFYEYFLISELMGAKALPVLNVGLACQFQSDELVDVDSEDFDEYIQDALDLIEFANGDVNTTWGAVRAEMGHPEPFGLEYIGIGNEQWETDRVDFFARYKAFEKAIHAVYPKIELLGSAGPFVNNDEYYMAWNYYREECANNPHFTAAVDEHYYMAPEWFLNNTHMYDNFSRDVAVFAGEYAAHNATKSNDWEAAIAEAAFMCGLERNGDVIRFASAAPLFCRKGYEQWIPDYIWFDGSRVVGTPGYYVQKLFSLYTGTEIMKCETDSICKKLHISASKTADKVFVKFVNVGDEEIAVTDTELDYNEATILQMATDNLHKVNALGDDDNLEPVEIKSVDGKIVLPAHSFTVVICA